MASKRQKKKTIQVRPELDKNAETPAAEAVTVAWMLCLFAGIVCGGGAGILRFFAHEEQPSLAMLSGLLFFAALAMGVLSLALLPVVLKSREIAPPRALVISSVVVAVLPWLILLAQLFRMES